MLKILFITVLFIYGFAQIIQSSGPDFISMSQDPNASVLARTLKNVVISDNQRIRFLNNHFTNINKDTDFKKIVSHFLNQTNIENAEKIYRLNKFVNHLGEYNTMFEDHVRSLNSTKNHFNNIKQRLGNSSLVYPMNTGYVNQELFIQLPGIGDHVIRVILYTNTMNNSVQLYFPYVKYNFKYNENNKYYKSKRVFEFDNNIDELVKFITILSNRAQNGNLDRPSINDANTLRMFGYLIDLIDTY
jgi:hypothetical protein